eukprot:m51a1_g13341 hypothetical protein (175) ;mRNA; f:1037-1622
MRSVVLCYLPDPSDLQSRLQCAITGVPGVVAELMLMNLARDVPIGSTKRSGSSMSGSGSGSGSGGGSGTAPKKPKSSSQSGEGKSKGKGGDRGTDPGRHSDSIAPQQQGAGARDEGQEAAAPDVCARGGLTAAALWRHTLRSGGTEPVALGVARMSCDGGWEDDMSDDDLAPAL